MLLEPFRISNPERWNRGIFLNQNKLSGRSNYILIFRVRDNNGVSKRSPSIDLSSGTAASLASEVCERLVASQGLGSWSLAFRA
jgi:hypothetical protein